MRFVADIKWIKYSPYKLRPLVDVIRGRDAVYALNWLSLYKTKKSIPVRKALVSAVANAKDRESIPVENLLIKEIAVNPGPIRSYFKPGAMGRAQAQRRRFCHIRIVLEPKESKRAS